MNRHAKIWFPFYVGDYLADTMHLTTQEHGAYLLILCHQWRQGHIREDELPQVTRLSGDAWSIAQARLKHLLSTDENGHFYSARLDREKARWTEKSTQAHVKATVAANARWKRYREGKAKQGQSGDAPSIPQAVHEQSPSSSPVVPSSELRSSSGERRAAALPPDVKGEDTAKKRDAAQRPARGVADASVSAVGVDGHENAENPTQIPGDVVAISIVNRSKWLLAEVKEFWVRMNVPSMREKDTLSIDDLAVAPWSRRDEDAAHDLLRAAPAFSQADARRCLEHRAMSVELGYLAASLQPSKWLRDLPGFLSGPLNQHGDPVPKRGGRLVRA